MFNCFKREIKISDDMKNELISIAPLKGGKVKFGTPLIVPDGFYFATGYNGRALDLLSSGTYCITEQLLPLTTSKLKLYKKDKNGKTPSEFKVNCYFINLKEFNVASFPLNRKLELSSNGKIIKQKIFLSYNFKIISAKDFLQYCLSEFDYLKKHEAYYLFKDNLDEYICSYLDKKKLDIDVLKTKLEDINIEIFNEMKNQMLHQGIEITSLKISLNKQDKPLEKVDKVVQNEDNQIEEGNNEIQ